MAEGGGPSSIKDGSDADFDIVCTPCADDDIREEAVKYCVECQEYLCTGCTKHHGKLKATRSHKLLDRDDVKQGSMVAIATKCRYHLDRNIEMYCGTHDMVYCTKCIAKEHRTCSGVNDIEDMNTSHIQQMEVQRSQSDATNIEEGLTGVEEQARKNFDSVENQKSDIVSQIEEAERSLIEDIGKLKLEAVDALSKKSATVKNELECNITVMANLRKEIFKSRNQLQKLASMDTAQQFVQMKLLQNYVNDAVALLEDRRSKGSHNLCFIENTTLMTSIRTATSLGHVNTVTEGMRRTASKVKSKKKINIKMKRDVNTCYITDVCQLHNGTIILADFFNKKIKRLHMNYYTIKDHCDLSAGPSGICCTDQNEVAVKTNNNKVQFISVGSSLSKLRDIAVDGGGYWGMTYYSGHLWISTGSGVNIYSTSGSLVKTISKDVNGKNIFRKYPQHFAESVVVADCSDGAVCLDKFGTVRKELRDSRLSETRGVCVSGDGTVFIAGFSSHNIVIFEKDGKCLRELEAKDIGLRNPMSIFYIEKTDSLCVTCSSSDEIIIIDISD